MKIDSLDNNLLRGKPMDARHKQYKGVFAHRNDDKHHRYDQEKPFPRSRALCGSKVHKHYMGTA